MEQKELNDLIDKARGLLIRHVKVIICTKPSIRMPRGGKYEGYIFDVEENKIILDDTYVMKRFEIYLSEIISPADIFEKEEKNGIPK